MDFIDMTYRGKTRLLARGRPLVRSGKETFVRAPATLFGEQAVAPALCDPDNNPDNGGIAYCL